MVYFANFDTYNFCLRGCNSGTQDPNNTEGMFNSAFVGCFNWPSWTTQGINSGDSSWSKYINQCASPNVHTCLYTNTNSKINNHLRYQGRPFGVNLQGKAADGIDYVRHTSPITSNSSGASGTVNGYNCVPLSSRQNFITVQAFMLYAYFFSDWRIASSSGLIAATSNPTSFFFNSTYGGVNFLSIKDLWATGFTFSDRRLKKDIKLVGKSNKGINIYTWRYKNPKAHGYGLYEGVMAQEVPYATIEHPNGYLMVDYSKTDVTFKKLYESNLGNRKRQEG